jgi:hypothetical protein
MEHVVAMEDTWDNAMQCVKLHVTEQTFLSLWSNYSIMGPGKYFYAKGTIAQLLADCAPL